MSNTNTHKPGYKQTPLGEIPDEWEVVKIIDAANYVDYRGKTPTKTESGRFLVTAKNIRNGFIDYELSKEYVSESDYNDTMRRGLPKLGDVLITTEAPLGSVAQIDREDIALAQRVIKYRAKKELLLNDYLKQYFISPFFQRILNEKSTGSTAKGIKGSVLHKLPLILPPFAQQQRIALVLSTWDGAIQTTQQVIELLKQRNKGLSQQLLSGKKRLKSYGGMWKNVMLGDVTTKITRRNGDLVEARVYSVTNSNGFVLQSDHFEREVAGADLSNYKIIKQNEFAYNPARINVGSIAYFTEPVGIISSLYVCFKTNPNLLDTFLWYLLDLDLTKHRIISLGEGGVRIYLWYDLFAKIRIALPTIEEQEAIMEILVSADNELKLYEQQLANLQQQKKGLMQKLLSGEVRVKT